jgi:ArsR family transcriptional regulator, lead/cadmium/zinc/bismuth-responsive transcriptional repressor
MRAVLPNRSDAGVCEVDYVDEPRVAAVRRAMPSDAVLSRAAEIFDVLSAPTRLRILLALTNQEELCVCDLSQIAERSVAATSHQLQTLRRLKLVTFRMEGKLAYYRLAEPLVRDLISRVAPAPVRQKGAGRR